MGRQGGAARRVALSLVGGLILASGAQADGPSELLVKGGADLYARHCASCHGTEGKVDGPVAESLRFPPSDLTRIAARRNGAFPRAELARFIDGRFAVAAHGTRDMPVWGFQFGKGIQSDSTAEEIVRGNISVLLDFLESIQVSEPEMGD